MNNNRSGYLMLGIGIIAILLFFGLGTIALIASIFFLAVYIDERGK